MTDLSLIHIFFFISQRAPPSETYAGGWSAFSLPRTVRSLNSIQKNRICVQHQLHCIRGARMLRWNRAQKKRKEFAEMEMPTGKTIQTLRRQKGPVSYTHLDVYKRQR